VARVLRRVLVLTGLFALGLAGAASARLVGTAAGPDPAPGAVSGTSTAATTSTGTTRAPATPTPAVPAPPSTTSNSPSTVVISGHGWGHGLGMSQWGAYGYALHGWTYDKILAHYYTGTAIGRVPKTTVRVLLVEGARRVVLGSSAPWHVTDATGKKVALSPGQRPVTAAFRARGK
jgi:hypothetical protein